MEVATRAAEKPRRKLGYSGGSTSKVAQLQRHVRRYTCASQHPPWMPPVRSQVMHAWGCWTHASHQPGDSPRTMQTSSLRSAVSHARPIQSMACSVDIRAHRRVMLSSCSGVLKGPASSVAAAPLYPT